MGNEQGSRPENRALVEEVLSTSFEVYDQKMRRRTGRKKGIPDSTIDFVRDNLIGTITDVVAGAEARFRGYWRRGGGLEWASRLQSELTTRSRIEGELLPETER